MILVSFQAFQSKTKKFLNKSNRPIERTQSIMTNLSQKEPKSDGSEDSILPRAAKVELHQKMQFRTIPETHSFE